MKAIGLVMTAIPDDDQRTGCAVAQSSNRRHSAHAGRQAEPFRARAAHRRRQAGSVRPMAAGFRIRDRYRARSQTRRGALPALGRGAAHAPPPDRQQGRPHRRLRRGRGPAIGFVPYPFKILQVPGMVVVLYEAVHSYRQIFTDGREFPADMNPAWFGYSIGRWEGETFAVQTTGFNDHGWLDNSGRPATDALRVTERFRRKDFGHMDMQITIDDPKAYTKPWTVTLPLTFQADTELLEYICNENNRYFELVPK